MLPRLERRVRVHPLAEVSRRSAAEAPARAAGMTADAVATIWRSVERLYQTGSYPAVALCLRRGGKVLLDGAIGHERGNSPDDPSGTPLVPATPDSLFCLFSASKAITAMVVHLLDDRGQLHLDDAVAEYIPEFGRHGKQWITLRHILTHRAGIPTIPGRDVDVDLLTDWDRIIAVLCDAKPTWAPGRRLAYHALTGGYVLGEVVRRVTGRDIRGFLRAEILDPLGIRHLSYGVAPELVDRVAQNARTGIPAPPPFSWLLRRALGVTHAEAVAISNDRRFVTSVVPSGNIIGTANEACRFFQLLLDEGELDGVRVFAPRTVRRAVAEQTYLELDLTLGLPIRYGMGMMLGAERLSPFGDGTPKAYGHFGFTNVVLWADPERDLSACLMTSGKPTIHRGLLAWLRVMRTVSQAVPRDRARAAFRPVSVAGRVPLAPRPVG